MLTLQFRRHECMVIKMLFIDRRVDTWRDITMYTASSYVNSRLHNICQTQEEASRRLFFSFRKVGAPECIRIRKSEQSSTTPESMQIADANVTNTVICKHPIA